MTTMPSIGFSLHLREICSSPRRAHQILAIMADTARAEIQTERLAQQRRNAEWRAELASRLAEAPDGGGYFD